jgi:ferrous iron transport protein A
MAQHPLIALSNLAKKQKAIIAAIDESACVVNQQHPGLLEQRLLEMGFVEGAPIMLLHEAPFTKDPIIVRLRNMRIALRRNEAQCILVQTDAPSHVQ